MQNFPTIQQGWQDYVNTPHNQQNEQNSQILNQKFISKDKPLGILSSNRHSLEPDMLFGWKPKLPSCPLPLKFSNALVDRILQLLRKDDRYRIAYKNKHFVSSIQVNQSYDYYWKYRTRYSLNIALVSQAVKSQQVQNNLLNSYNNISNIHFIQQNVQKCEYSFDSSFQSGNLDLAIRIKHNEYDCFIRSDSNTKGHCNWYYFKVTNNDKIGEVKINICNMAKKKNLYNKGMRPYILEMNKNQNQWTQQSCYNIEYYQRICRYGTDTKRNQLQFKYNFTQPNQQIYLAYGIPYTYSRLEAFIKEITNQCRNEDMLVSEKLCESLGGVNIPLLKITKNASQISSVQTNKRAIIISARIHPGQAHSSFLVEGFIRELLKKNKQYDILRKMFIFYIIPMLNPDGVIVGNYRTSYSGKDLNRQFKNMDNYVFPEISRLHDLALQIRQKHFKGIEFYFDFHGHSSKKNMFAYGPQHNLKNIYFFKSRIFPRLIEDFHPIFSYKKSIFKISEGKKKTARAHMLWNLKIPMVYTFEVSNGMYEYKKKDFLLTSDILLEAGQAVMKGLYKYVRIQMRIPHNLLSSKKQPKQNKKKRAIRSSKVLRDRDQSSLKKGNKSNQLKDIMNQMQKNFKSQKIVLQKDHDKRNDQVFQFDENLQYEDNMDCLQEFIELVEEINNTKPEHDLEGGSDSQTDGEDLTKEETEKLFSNIKNQKLLKNVIKQVKNHKSTTRTATKKFTDDMDSNNLINQIKNQLKQYKSNDVQTQQKKHNNQRSQGSLLGHNVRKTTRSPSLVLKRFEKSFNRTNIGMRTSKDLRGTQIGIRTPYTSEKVQKVPIVQRRFNLQIDNHYVV